MKDEKPVASSLPGEVPPVKVESKVPTDKESTPPEAPEPQGQGPTLPQVLEEIYKRIESLKFNIDADHGTLLKHDDILHKVDNALDKLLTGMQSPSQMPNTAQGGFSLGGITMKDLLDTARAIGLTGGPADPMAALHQAIGEKVVGKTLDSVVNRIVKNIGTETASHVVVDNH